MGIDIKEVMEYAEHTVRSSHTTIWRSNIYADKLFLGLSMLGDLCIHACLLLLDVNPSSVQEDVPFAHTIPEFPVAKRPLSYVSFAAKNEVHFSTPLL